MIFNFRLTPAEKDDLQTRARQAGLSMSEYIRSRLWEEAWTIPTKDHQAKPLAPTHLLPKKSCPDRCRRRGRCTCKAGATP